MSQVSSAKVRQIDDGFARFFPCNRGDGSSRFEQVRLPVKKDILGPLHEQGYQRVRDLITDPTKIRDFVQKSGLIFYNPEDPLFATKDEHRELIARFFREVPMPGKCFSFANAQTIRNLSLSNGQAIDNVAGTALNRSALGRVSDSCLKGSLANFNKLLSQIACPVANIELDKAIWRWGFKASQQELEKHGIFYDANLNKVYLVDIGEEKRWRDCPIKIVRGNNIATITLSHFPHEDFVLAHSTKASRCLNDTEGLKRNLEQLGFDIANDIETALFVRNNEQARTYLNSKYIHHQVSSSKLAELARIIARAKFHQKGATDIEVVEVPGTVAGAAKTSKILLASNPDTGKNYGFLVKASTNGGEPDKPRDSKFISDACKLIGEQRSKEYRPCILHVKNLDPRTWTANLEASLAA